MAKELKINLTVNDDGTVVIKNFSDQAATNLKKVENAGNSMASSFAKSWQGMVTGFNQGVQLFHQATAVLSKAWNLADQSAKFEQQKKAFDNLTASYGKNGTQIIEELKRVSSNTINTMTLIEKAGTAMMMGITPDKVSKLMEIARATARMTGQSVSQAFSDISLAVGRQSKMILDNLGIIVSVEKANETYAASLGKTASSLTDVEKKTAFLNATIAAGTELMQRLGEQQDSTRDKMDRLKATMDNSQIMLGQLVTRAAIAATASFQYLASGVLGLVAAYSRYRTMVYDVIGDEAKAESNRINATAAWEARNALAKEAADNFGLLTISQEEWSKAMAGATTQLANQTGNILDATKAMETHKEAIDAVRKEAQTYLKELNTDLSAKKKYYADLEKMIKENVEAEKKAAADKAELRRREIDINKSADKMMAELSGAADKMTDVEKHAAALKELEAQYSAAVSKGGKEGVDALEEYKKGIVSLQNQYKNLEDATKNAENAQRDVSLATAQQQAILSEMEYQNFLTAQSAAEKGEALQAESKKSKLGIEEVNKSIERLNKELTAIDKTLDIKAVDNASSVIDNIIAKMRQLHAENTALNMGSGGSAAYATAVTPGVFGGTPSAQLSGVSSAASELAKTAESASASIEAAASGWTGLGISADGGQTWSSGVEGSYGLGTDYVPKTGKYILHQGEMVIPPGMADAIRSEDSRLSEMVTRLSGVINATVSAVAAASVAVEQTAEDMAALIKRQFETFQNAFGSFTNYLETRERRSWGQAEYNAEFARLEAQFGQTEDFDRQIELLDQMLGVIQHLEDIELEALEAQKRMSAGLREQKQSTSDWLVEISQGRLAPVQSAEGWAAEFNRMLYAAATNEEKVGEFLSYAKQYLEFAKVYGTDQSYGAAYSQVTSAVGSLGSYMDLASKLSDLGLGDNLAEINGLIAAFDTLGISSEDLTKAVNSVAGDVENASSLMVSASGTVPTAAELARVGIIPLATTLTNTLPAAVSQAIGSAGLQSLNMALVDAIPASIRTAIGAEGIGKLEKSMIQAIPTAVAVATGSAGTDALEAALTSSIPESIKTAIGAQGMASLVASLSNTLPAAVATAVGAQGLATLTTAIGTTIPTAAQAGVSGSEAVAQALVILQNAATTSTGTEGLGKLINALAATLPQSAIDSMENAGLLARVLSDPTGTENMSALVATMTTNVQSQLTTVAGFFDQLATRMGLTMNGGSVATAIAALTPPPVQVAATKSVVSTVETSPFIPAHYETIWSTPLGTGRRDWIPDEPAHGKIIWSDGTITEYAKGGLTSGTSIAGELGPEWVVPTYEPERSKFLSDVGADPDKIAAGVARMLGQGGPGAGGDSNITVIVQLDGNQVARATAKQIRGGNTELIAAMDGRIKARMN